MATRSHLFSAVLVALGLPVTAALGGVDETVAPNAKVKGTIFPSGEQERFVFEAPAGALFNVTVTAKKKAPLDFTLRVFDDRSDVDLTEAKRFKDRDKRVQVRGLELPRTGAYTLVVSATGTGEYAIAFKVKPRATWKSTLEVPAGKSARYDFAAPPDAKIKARAKRSKKSPAAPHFTELDGRSIWDQGKVTPRAHTCTIDERTDELDDHEFEVSNESDTDGDIDVTVTLKWPRVKVQKLDVRGEDGEPPVASATVPAVTGGEVFANAAAGVLAGARVNVPAGALAQDTLISIARDPDAAVADPVADVAAGPAVLLAPGGTTFATPVTVTLPFDATRITRGGSTADVRVLHITSSGESVLTPTTISAGTGLLTVETGSFSTLLPFVPVGTPDLSGRSYWTVEMEAELVPENPNVDTRERRIRLALGVAQLNGGVTYDREVREVRWNHPTNGVPQALDHLEGTVTTTDDVESGAGTWDYVDNFRGVQVAVGRLHDTFFALNADGVVLAGGQENSSSTGIVSLWVERPHAPVDAALLDGNWWIGRITARCAPNPNGAAGVTFERRFGTLKLKKDGGVELDIDVGSNPWDAANESFAEVLGTEHEFGTWTQLGTGRFAGGLLVDVGGTTSVVLPSLDMNVLVGAATAAPDGTVDWFVAVRKQKDLGRDDLGGDYRARWLYAQPGNFALDLDPDPVGEMQFRVPSFSIATNRELRTFPSGGQSFHYTDISQYGIRRSTSLGSVSVTGVTSVRDEIKRYDLERDGRYLVTSATTGNSGTRGAVAPAERFGFGLFDPEGYQSGFGFEFFVRMPTAGP